MPDFVGFPKVPRLSSEMIITEKIDGTNAQIYISDVYDIHVGSRKRWLTKESDNYGFWKWAHENSEELLKLGPGHHFGEWWGQGIQRNYGLNQKKFSLFNVHRWNEDTLPECCSVVPILAKLEKFDTIDIQVVMRELKEEGSYAAPGFMNPEGVVIQHVRSQQLFKKTFEGDDGKEKKMRETKRITKQIKESEVRADTKDISEEEAAAENEGFAPKFWF